MAATKDFPEDRYLVFATKNGLVKKTALSAYANVRSGGIIAINLEEGDELLSVRITDGERPDLHRHAARAMGIRFSEKDVRAMGRDTTGVIGISLKKSNDEVVEMDVVDEKAHLLTVTEHGYGKRSEVAEYRYQGRGGSGVINLKVTEKNGPVVGIKSVTDADQLLLITPERHAHPHQGQGHPRDRPRRPGRAADRPRRRRSRRRRGEARRARRGRRRAAGRRCRRSRPRRPRRAARRRARSAGKAGAPFLDEDDEDDEDDEAVARTRAGASQDSSPGSPWTGGCHSLDGPSNPLAPFRVRRCA